MNQNEIEDLKTHPNVMRIYANYSKMKKDGAGRYVGLCPLHREGTPSFTIFPDGRWHCFGGCGSGNCVQLIERAENVPFAEAVEKAKEMLGDWETQKRKVDQVFKSVVEPKTFKTIPLSLWSKTEAALLNSREALSYLEKERGISAETAKKMRLGFVQDIRNLAGESGADIAAGGWIAIPYIDEDVIRLVKFRSIKRKKPGGMARQPGMETVLYNTNTIDVFEPVYLVSGEYDCCIMEQAGFRTVSLCSDSSKPTPEQKDLLMKASYVILAGDSDEAGVGIMGKLWRELNNCFMLKWPSAKDANEYFLKQCKGDVSIFRTKVEELTSLAKSQPMPDVFSIQEVMVNGEDKSLSERPDRLRFPWTGVDQMAVLLPGSVLGVMATSTGSGKTTFTLQASLFGARKYNEVVVNWQCELSPSEIANMVAAQILRKNRNFLSKEDRQAAAAQLDGVQYYVGNNANISDLDEVLDLMEAAVKRLGATVCVLDNAHYYTSGVDDEVRVLAAGMKRMKQMAIQYGLKWIVVFQPRKAPQNAKGRKTHISDVKGSATAGDTCDAVFAIHRELAKDTEEGKNDIYDEKSLIEALKTRSKGIGKSSTFLHFFGEFSVFESIDLSHEEIPD